MKIKIGLLFSQSGTTSIVEKGQLNASLLAIEELNRNSGIQFEPVIGDVKSDPEMAAKEAYRLLKEAKSNVLVGCYTSACRKAVITVLNETGGLLLYPTLYEGEERHPHIFYCGAVPNQQVEPMLSWSITNISDRFVMIGSDYVYPRSTNRQVKDWILRAGGTITCESYYPLGSSEFSSFFRKINSLSKYTSSLVIFSTLVGTSIISFYREYRKRKLPFPIVSPITSEIENYLMGNNAACGHFCTSAYFQNVDNEANTRFIRAYTKRFGREPISRELASSYEAINLLHEAYSSLSTKASSQQYEIERLRWKLKTLSFHGPQGKVIMDPKLQHLWQWSRIGRVKSNGKIDIVWTSTGPIAPRQIMEPCPPSLDEQSKSDVNGAFASLIGKARSFKACVSMAKIAAKTSSNVLITGKSGTGKEMFAKAIHNASARGAHSFIPVNCGAIPRDLISSELFGYEEGSFTGAKKGGKPGKFELADKGTLFLDEVGEMPLELQTHLLRVLQEKEVYRIGSSKPIRINVRIIAATSRDLPQEIAYNGSFRSDLYFRLNVFHIDIPLLRQRGRDIPILSNYFLQKLNIQNQQNKTFAEKTLNMLAEYTWPGNVRELSNVLESSFYVCLAQGLNVILPRCLPKRIAMVERKRGDSEDSQATFFNLKKIGNYHLLKKSIRNTEEQHIKIAIRRSGYNISSASRLLGISRSTLYRKIKKYHINTTPEWELHQTGKSRGDLQQS